MRLKTPFVIDFPNPKLSNPIPCSMKTASHHSLPHPRISAQILLAPWSVGSQYKAHVIFG